MSILIFSNGTPIKTLPRHVGVKSLDLVYTRTQAPACVVPFSTALYRTLQKNISRTQSDTVMRTFRQYISRPSMTDSSEESSTITNSDGCSLTGLFAHMLESEG